MSEAKGMDTFMQVMYFTIVLILCGVLLSSCGKTKNEEKNGTIEALGTDQGKTEGVVSDWEEIEKGKYWRIEKGRMGEETIYRYFVIDTEKRIIESDTETLRPTFIYTFGSLDAYFRNEENSGRFKRFYIYLHRPTEVSGDELMWTYFPKYDKYWIHTASVEKFSYDITLSLYSENHDQEGVVREPKTNIESINGTEQLLERLFQHFSLSDYNYYKIKYDEAKDVWAVNFWKYMVPGGSWTLYIAGDGEVLLTVSEE